jgi:hypothetical protein
MSILDTLKLDFSCNQLVTCRMTSKEAEAVRSACADLVRLLHNMSEALAAASNATRLCAEATEGIERDLISIATLVEHGD